MYGCKLLVMDLDGTLVNDRKEITPATLYALNKIQQQGVRIVLASGRPTFSIRPLAEQLRLKEYGGYILSYNGARIENCSNDELLFSMILPEKVLPYLYKCSQESGYSILAYQDGYVVTEHDQDSYVKMVSFGNKMPIRKLTDFLKEIKLPLHKCLMVGNPEGLHHWELKMRDEIGHEMSVYRSSPFIMELVPFGIEKARSLAQLVSHLGLTAEQVVAVGDGYNDISMLQYAGMGIAMRNAVPEVQKAANWTTTRSNNEDGIVEIIEKLFTNDSIQR